MNSLIVSTSAIALLVNALTFVTSTYIVPRWGKTGVQVIVAFFATVGAVYMTYRTQLQGVEAFLTQALAIMALAITFYEVLFSKVEKLKD